MPDAEVQTELPAGLGPFDDGRRPQQQPVGKGQPESAALPDMAIAAVNQIAVVDAQFQAQPEAEAEVFDQFVVLQVNHARLEAVLLIARIGQRALPA